jgi:hypothetical protein
MPNRAICVPLRSWQGLAVGRPVAGLGVGWFDAAAGSRRRALEIPRSAIRSARREEVLQRYRYRGLPGCLAATLEGTALRDPFRHWAYVNSPWEFLGIVRRVYGTNVELLAPLHLYVSVH